MKKKITQHGHYNLQLEILKPRNKIRLENFILTRKFRVETRQGLGLKINKVTLRIFMCFELL